MIIDECTDVSIFVGVLLEEGVLKRGGGGNSVLNNCSIHMKGDNSDLQGYLFEKAGVLMVPLPPCWVELKGRNKEI